MNTFIETLNQWGGDFLGFAWPMLWQASLLTVILFSVDYLGRRQVRASVRYTLWLVMLVKLCLPPTLALPTSPVWWLHQTQFIIVPAVTRHYSVTYDQEMPSETLAKPVPDLGQRPPMTGGAGMLVTSVTVSTILLLWLLVRWAQVIRRVRQAAESERLNGLLQESKSLAGLNFPVQGKVTANSMSPAVCGLLRPVILIPDSLLDTFSDEQLRAVLLHELIHLRRRDVWVNFLQALLQIVYWWHPLVWLANARIRATREEAVDDAVVLALRDEAENYAPTLLAVAKLALRRPMASLGLVGIMESRHALRQRIERLLDARTPRRTGLTLASLLGILAFTTVAVPMGDAPVTVPEASTVNEPHRQAVLVTAEFYAVPDADGLQRWSFITQKSGKTLKSEAQQIWMVFTEKTRATMEARLRISGLRPFFSPRLETTDGVEGIVSTSNGTNVMKFSCCPVISNGSVKLAFGADIPRNMSGSGQSLPATTVRETILIEDRGGIYLCKATEKNHLLMIIEVKLVTNSPPIKTSQIAPAANSESASFTQSQTDSRVRTELTQKPTRLQLHIKARFMEVPKGTWDSLEKFPVTTTNRDNGMVGILTSQQQKTVLQNLRRDSTVYNYAEPEVTTLSGRRTQVRATSLVTVITNVAYNDTATNGSIALTYETGKLETGPVFDVASKVLADGYTIDLSALASLTEFVGYDTPPTNTTLEHFTDTGVKLPMILPSWYVRQAGAHIRLWDGQTVAFGKIEKRHFPDGKEIGGATDNKDSELLILLTVWVVDPAGNRIHSDDQLSFAQNAIPPQTVAGQKPILWQTFGGSASKTGD